MSSSTSTSSSPSSPSPSSSTARKKFIESELSAETDTHERTQHLIWTKCRRDSNTAGLQGGVIAAGLAVATNYLLNRTSQSYKNRIELTGKLLMGSIFVYGVFYTTSFYANKHCVMKNSDVLKASIPIHVGYPMSKYGGRDTIQSKEMATGQKRQ